jgi:hypothetical protein
MKQKSIKIPGCSFSILVRSMGHVSPHQHNQRIAVELRRAGQHTLIYWGGGAEARVTLDKR